MEAERNGDWEIIRGGRRQWSRRVITHAPRPAIGSVFMLRWLHINLCKWGLWLYFHEASKEETTGLLPMKKPETKVENMAESSFSLPSLQQQTFSHTRHYAAQLRKGKFAMRRASVCVCAWIPTWGDEGKSSAAEWRMNSTSQRDKQIVE